LFVVLAGLPVWVLYRILGHRVYRQIDRLSAECVELRTRLDDARREQQELAARVFQAKVRVPSRVPPRARRARVGSENPA
jgi:hypothetical protein